MAVNIKRPARARIWKRIAITGACVTSLAIGVLIIISLLQRGSDAFSIRIDNPTEETPFHIAQFGYNNVDEDGNLIDENGDIIQPEDAELDDQGVYVKGKAVDNMEPTYAAKILEYLESFEKNDRVLNGSNNFIEDGIGKALVYTVYLVNDSQESIEDLKYAVKLEGTSDSSYHYLRILCQTQFIDDNNKGIGKAENAFYGETYVNTTDSSYGSLESPSSIPPDAVGMREPISNRRIKTEQKKDKDGIPVTDKDGKPVYTKVLYAAPGYGDGDPENEDNYCHNFVNIDGSESTDSKSYEIINSNIQTIKPGQKLRFTFVAYFEGNDVHCQGSAPPDSFILLSLHFGQ